MTIVHDYLIDVGLIIWLCMTILFVFAIIRKDNSIVDVFWGLGFLIVGVYSLIQSGEIDIRKIIVNLFVGLWGLRLATHILTRNQGKGEDFRYKAWRDRWKWFYLRSYFQIFMLQGTIMLIISFPIWYINFSTGHLLGIWDLIGLVLFGTGFLMEVMADSQLTEFKKQPGNKGKLMTTGLWAVSRHPNYFGEALLWWGFSSYAISLPGGWMTLISPILMTLLLRYVSGVPMLEARYQSHPEWNNYKSRTPVFFPFIK